MLRLGIDLGGTKTEAIIMDPQGAVLLRQRRPTPSEQGYSAILDNVRSLVADLESQAGETCHVGIGTPGAISSRTGKWKNSNTTCLNGQALQQDIEKLLTRKVRIENDANCFTLSEALDGAGQGHDMVFGVILGTGVGGGIVVKQQLHHGAQAIAGEWGHNTLEANGPVCYCGKRGCIETLLSGPGMRHDFQQHGGNRKWQPQDIVAAAARGDARAEDCLQRYLQRFGHAMAMVVNILDPHAIVLGGGMSNITQLYAQGKEQLANQVFNDELLTLLLPNRHGDSAGVRGAACLWPAQENEISD